MLDPLTADQERFGPACCTHGRTAAIKPVQNDVFDRAGGTVAHDRAAVLQTMTGSTQNPCSRRDPGPRPVLSHHTTNGEAVTDRGDEIEVSSKYLRLGQRLPETLMVVRRRGRSWP